MHFDRKKIFILGFIIVLLAAIPLTVLILEKQQETRSRAAKSTVLSFVNAASGQQSSQTNPIIARENEEFKLDVVLNPGTNLVNALILKVDYDPSLIATSSAGSTCQNALCPNPNSLFLGEVEYTDGRIAASFSKNTDVARIVQTETKIATLTFKALKKIDTTEIKFSGETIVKSSLKADREANEQPENVLSSTNPAWIKIAAGATTPTPTISLTPTPTRTIGDEIENEVPVCTSLNIDRDIEGEAPFSITFTAVGTDTDGTIKKATFNFGDGPVQDVIQAGGIGTDSVSVQTSHTYLNPGTYQASAILTDNSGGISDSTTCTQTITVTESIANNNQPPVPTEGEEIIPKKEFEPTEAPGPSAPIVGIGIGAFVVSMLGALIFLAL